MQPTVPIVTPYDIAQATILPPHLQRYRPPNPLTSNDEQAHHDPSE